MDKLQIQNRYGVTPNEILNNKNLSFKAKGLFAYIQSKPDGWDFSAARIANDSNDGVDSVTSGLKELEENGYLIRRKFNGEGGLLCTEYVLIDKPEQPLREKPRTVKPRTEKPLPENPRIYKERISKKDISNKEGYIYISEPEIFDSSNTKTPTPPDCGISPSSNDFEEFWEVYDKKVDKIKCERKWKNMTKKDREKALQVAPLYVKNTPDRQYRKNPLTYLNSQTWNDEIIGANNKQNGNLGKELADIALEVEYEYLDKGIINTEEFERRTGIKPVSRQYRNPNSNR